ncbi:MAG TPA: hypothetical protein VGC42_05145 [Kofleriaceae bacterium]
MLRFALAASLVFAAGCRIQLSDAPASQVGDDGVDGGSSGRACTVSTSSPSCLAADMQQPAPTLGWVEANIFKTSCVFSGCHNGGSSKQGMVDLRVGMSYAHLVGYTSMIDPSRKLVVANDVHASYLMLMLHDYEPAMATPAGSSPPGDIGYMPQGTSGEPLCCQKLDALERWITAGAPNN